MAMGRIFWYICQKQCNRFQVFSILCRPQDSDDESVRKKYKPIVGFLSEYFVQSDEKHNNRYVPLVSQCKLHTFFKVSIKTSNLLC